MPKFSMKMLRSVIVVLAVSVLVFVLIGQADSQPELDASNWLFRLRATPDEESAVVVVAIDDESLAVKNKWPWPRDYMAQIINEISAADPAVIAVDIFFFDESGDPEADAKLAEAVANAGNVVLTSEIVTVRSGNADITRHSRPLDEFEGGAAAVGLANFPLDRDDALRRLLAYQELNGELYYSWALESARLYFGEDTFVPAPNGVWIGENFVELERRLLRVDYIGGAAAGGYQIFPAHQVADGAINASAFTGKVVLIGATAASLHDSYPTPFGNQPPMPGVEVNAQAVDAIIHGRYIHIADNSLRILMVVIASIMGMLIARRLGLLLGIISVLGLMAFFFISALLIFINASFILPIIAPMVALLISYGGQTGLELYDERQQGQRLRSVLSQIEREKRTADNLLHVVIPAGAALSADEDHSRLSEMLVGEMRNLCNAEVAVLYVDEGDGNLVPLVATDGKARDPIPLLDADGLANSDDVVGYAAAQKEVTLIADVYAADAASTFTDTKKNDAESGTKTVSLLAYPFRNSKEKLTAIIVLTNALDYDTGDPIPFAEGMVQLVSSLAWMVSVAVGSHLKEIKYQKQLVKLEIQIDETKKEEDVTAVLESDFFTDLQAKAQGLRRRKK